MEKGKRYVVFLIGLFVNSFGVSFVTKGSIGTSPISSIPYVLSLNFAPTLGNFTILMSIGLILLQILLLRKVTAEVLLQIPISVLFGYFIDWTMLLLSGLALQSYPAKLLALLVGCAILGFGVYLEVLANVAMLPGEGTTRAISERWHTEFGVTKIAVDVSMTVTAAVLSLIFAHKIDGVREGTVIAALAVGFIARQLSMWLKGVERVLFGASQTQEVRTETASGEESADADTRVIITIGRQYGCGGRQIGKELAERFGIAFYDRHIIRLAAGTTGYTPDFISKREESLSNTLLFDLVKQMYGYNAGGESPKDQIFSAEEKVIREIADRGSCVIVGRMSDYILKDRKDVVRAFLHTSMQNRIASIMQRDNLTAQLAEEKIVKEEKRRSVNYHHYTRQIWGFAGNYDVAVDSSLGIDLIEQIIRDTLAAKREEG